MHEMTDGDLAAFAELRRETIAADRFPLSPLVLRGTPVARF